MNDYPNTRRMKDGTGHALTGIYASETWSRSTRAESEDFGDVTELEFYQYALQWGMGISLKIRKGDVETSIFLDVDRAELLGRWLIEAARDTKRWRAENPDAWNYEMDTSDNVPDRIDEPAVGEGELGSDRVKYFGDRPVETAKNGLQRVGPHSRYGFGELRLKPLGEQYQ